MPDKIQERLRVEQLLDATQRDWQGLGGGGWSERNFAVASFTEVFALLRIGVDIGFLNRGEVNRHFREQAHRVLAAYDDYSRWAGVHESDVRESVESAIHGKPF